MKNLIIVRDIESIKYLTDEYIILNFYISDLINSQIEIIKITAEIHLICNLKAKLLIEIDITSKNNLEKITEMKEEDCYLINENSHDFVILKLISKCECFKCSHSLMNTEEDVTIFYDIKVHKNVESHCFDEIVNKYSNV